MILFTILTLILIFLVAFMILIASAGGAIFTILFSDVIVCGALIAFVLWLIIRKKKK